MQTVWILLAAIAGFALGFWLKSILARARTLHLEQDNGKLSAELNELKQELTQAKAESGSRAGFEALAAERQGAIVRLETERNTLREELRVKTGAERDQAASIGKLEAELRSERANLAEKLAILDNAKQALVNQFQALAGEILETKSKAFSETNKNELGTLLDPLKIQIKEFRDKVEEAQRESLIGRTEMASELKQLKDLNENLSAEAHSLSTALRQDTQKQGHWGEFILLNILENSGLRKGEHYTYQESFTVEDEEGSQDRRRQTDVIVKLPEGRHLIIDCKVTLNAYDDYVRAESDKEREEAVKRLLRSFRDHYTGLAERNYHRISQLQSPDFVVLFAPVEPAFMLAMQKDESLWADAYQKGVLLAGPTTVLFVVRIVENLWRQEQQAENVQKVMDRGGKLYDKFVGFVEDLKSVGERISDADQSYRDAFSKLTTGRENLVRQVEMLRELKVKNKKRLKPKLLEAAGADVDEEDANLPLLAAEAEGGEAEQGIG
ncbi:MAG TPA: DNA recombination protein RmuC [Terracidiphilus sp.]|jgi:DNA recombination protein RmuC